MFPADLVGMLPITCDAARKLRGSHGKGFVKPPQTATLGAATGRFNRLFDQCPTNYATALVVSGLNMITLWL